TWVYAFAAGHHPELRLHRATRAEWDLWEQRLPSMVAVAPAPAASAAASVAVPRKVEQPAARPGFGRSW
nr:hypothetical protein [Burkholderiaceae bacterium]